jgi:hypothetical protein
MCGAISGHGPWFTKRQRQAIHTYLLAAGTDGGYGFFAPGVPDSLKLVFEVHHLDGRIEYELPPVHSAAAGLRLSSLLDTIGHAESEDLREVMLKIAAYSVWQEHQDTSMIRAVLGYIDIPTPAEAASGKTESYKFLYAYDFRFADKPDGSANQ